MVLLVGTARLGGLGDGGARSGKFSMRMVPCLDLTKPKLVRFDLAPLADVESESLEGMVLVRLLVVYLQLRVKGEENI